MVELKDDVWIYWLRQFGGGWLINKQNDLPPQNSLLPPKSINNQSQSIFFQLLLEHFSQGEAQ